MKKFERKFERNLWYAPVGLGSCSCKRLVIYGKHVSIVRLSVLYMFIAQCLAFFTFSALRHCLQSLAFTFAYYSPVVVL